MSLLHSHTSFLNGRPRFSRRYAIGNVAEQDLRELWYAPEHVEFRERVQAFGSAPCTFCGGCKLSLDMRCLVR
ncbi:MAG TPA: hypothetical protein EYH31_08255 [Anaerolineae bacterium]|nr:hypothetical protein [Anaerolineae bacterium]